MLKIKKSHFDGSFVLYDPNNFERHTHIQKLSIANVVKRNVEKNLLPKTDNVWLLESHIRVSSNKKYIELVKAKIESLNGCTAG